MHSTFWLSGPDESLGIVFFGISTAPLMFLPTLKTDPATGDLDSAAPLKCVRKLAADQRSNVLRPASTRSLRELAAIFDVSHETIQSVLRSSPVEAMAAD